MNVKNYLHTFVWPIFAGHIQCANRF